MPFNAAAANFLSRCTHTRRSCITSAPHHSGGNFYPYLRIKHVLAQLYTYTYIHTHRRAIRVSIKLCAAKLVSLLNDGGSLLQGKYSRAVFFRGGGQDTYEELRGRTSERDGGLQGRRRGYKGYGKCVFCLRYELERAESTLGEVDGFLQLRRVLRFLCAEFL